MKTRILKLPFLRWLPIGFALVSLFLLGFYFGARYKKCFLEEDKKPFLSDENSKDSNKITLSSVSPVLTKTPTNSLPSPVKNYFVPQSWKRVSVLDGLKLCLPAKWEVDQWGNVYFNRDPNYRPNVTYIQEIPYDGNSYQESFYRFWEQNGYENVRETVKFRKVIINGNTVLNFDGPEGEKVVWFAKERLWQAGISGWEWVNNSKEAFLKDFYTMISCSF